MARTPSLTAQVELHRNFLEGVAKRMADEVWGPNGPVWGTPLTEMEDLALVAREIFTQKFLELGLERQSATFQEQRPAETLACPECEQPFDEPPEETIRDMQTRGGNVVWKEPKEYCTRCRRAFFPSEQKFGH